jgi:hypothetical protein
MMKIDNKTKRYSMRMNVKTLERLREIASALHTPLSDVLVWGAFTLAEKIMTESDYLKAKSVFLANAAEDKKKEGKNV